MSNELSAAAPTDSATKKYKTLLQLKAYPVSPFLPVTYTANSKSHDNGQVKRNMAYSTIPDTNPSSIMKENHEKHNGIQFAPRRKTRSWVIALGIGATVLLTILFIHDAREAMQPDSCGSSAAEAVSLGCQFDVTSFAWLPERCFDGELVDQFLSLRDWEWFWDAEGRETVDLESIKAGSHDQLYVTQEYHMYHCTYMWRKMHRAMLKDEPLDGYIASLMHTEHCEEQLIHRTAPLNDTSVSIFTKFVNCPSTKQSLRDRGWYRVIDGEKKYGSFESHHH